ncbi:MAG: hypothetical protein J6K20_04695 [Thermoguttaceae bacterium]|nr:hypothetical protein [Thermoguttaceae bacterium]
MKALYSLILASGTKEALFAALWLALNEEPGTFADVDFASLRTTASRFGVALSESQIRKRVKELEKLDVLAVVPRRERGRFDLLVYQPAPNRFNVDATAPKPEPATPLFDAAFGVGVESFAKPTVATKPTVPVFAAVSETETETAPETVATAQTTPSKAERADALLARTRFADALRRAVYPSDYNTIHCQTRLYRGEPLDGLSVGEVDLIDWRVGEFVVESRKIVGEYVDRSIAGEYRGRRDVYEAEMNAALLAFAKTRAAAIAPEPVEAVDATKAVESIRDRSRSAESASREPVAAPLEEINIKNKTINKPAKDFETLGEDVGDQRGRNRVRAIPERPAAPRDGSRAVAVAPSVAGVRELVDFESPKVAAFRRLVARNVWERTIHPDLIDRIVALAVLRVGGTDAKAVESMIRDAKAEVALWNRTDGRRGQPQIWRAITPEVKRLYENAGWIWSPTRFATEPRPEPRRAAETVEA